MNFQTLSSPASHRTAARDDLAQLAPRPGGGFAPVYKLPA